MNLIRKISIGPDYLNAMHFSIDQPVIRKTHTIVEIKRIESDTFEIWIANDKDEAYLWKSIEGMPVVIEFNIDY
tara:strand:- start:947 stop:1168 length:222 start_codon:yes stop_codon:yes gene_type:complete